MKFNYKLNRICGSPYGPTTTTINTTTKSPNLIYDSTNQTLLSPSSNRIHTINLQTQSTHTLPLETRSDIAIIALSPDNHLLLAIDIHDYAVLANYSNMGGVVLHRFRFKERVRCCVFSPDGRFFAVSHRNGIAIWHSPVGRGRRREHSPLVLHRTYSGLADEVLDVSWSDDCSVVLGCGKDGTVKIWSVETVGGFESVVLRGGHRGWVLGGYFELPRFWDGAIVGEGKEKRLRRCFTVSTDGALVTWTCRYKDEEEKQDKDDALALMTDSAVDFFSGSSNKSANPTFLTHKTSDQAHQLCSTNTQWSVTSRHYFHQNRSTVSTSTFSNTQNLLVLGFTNGIFGIYELPSVSNIHTLSISSTKIDTCCINSTGEWIGFGCGGTNRQVLVWEWKSETYILKQKGHGYSIRCMSYSFDGVVIVTGGEDGHLKFWDTTTGFCFCTMEECHSSAVSDVKFGSKSVVLSCGLDGMVKAHDLNRYRTFRNFSAPTGGVQFLALAVDGGGGGGGSEVVVAGSSDPFHIYVWSIQTSQLLDVFTGHLGPVVGLAFHPNDGMLLSVSWDGTAKMWDLYGSNSKKKQVDTTNSKGANDESSSSMAKTVESFQHNSDVVCCDFRPDGKQICTGSINGLLSFWNVDDSSLACQIDGRMDILGGRKMFDRMTSVNNSASRYFTSVCYSADGTCVLAGGNSKFVCIYEVSQQILLKKYQISHNRTYDGILDELNSKNLGEAGPIDDSSPPSETSAPHQSADFTPHLPGAKRNDDGTRPANARTEIQTYQVAFSSTGREWSTISNEGLHIYSLDDDMIFDPTDHHIHMGEHVTPQTIMCHLQKRNYGLALRMSLRLNESKYIRMVIEQTPHNSISSVIRGTFSNSNRHHHPKPLVRLLHHLSVCMEESPHVEFYLEWCLQILKQRGLFMERHRGSFLRAFRAVYKSVKGKEEELKGVCDGNVYGLRFLEDQASLLLSPLDGGTE